MVDIILMIYTYFTEYIKLWLVLWGIMNIPAVKKKSVYALVFLVQTAFLIFSSIQYTTNRDFAIVINTIAVVFAVCFIFEGNFFKKFAYSLLAYVMTLVLDSCVVGILSLNIDKTGLEIINSSIPKIVTDAFNVITIGIAVLIRKFGKKAKTAIRISRRVYALLFAGAGTGFFTLAALLVNSNEKTTDQARKAMIVVTVVVVITYLAACFMIIIITDSRDNYKALSLISQNIIESQQQYYSLVNEKQQEMRGIRHEIRNHLSCIHGLYTANKLEEMDRYLQQLIEESSTPEVLFETGNDIVNAILNDAQSRYRKERIELRLEGGFPGNLKIAPMDLCVIFANVVNNAIEAILRKDRNEDEISYIDIWIRSFKEDLYIDISNPIGNHPEILNGRLMTSKQDKSLHGFGIKNVIQRVEKYGGTFQYQLNNNQFTVEIHLINKA